MPPKMDDDDKQRKALAEDSTSTLASMKAMSEKALKAAVIVTKTPNVETMKALVKILDDLLGDADDMKKNMKDMKQLTKA